MTEIRCAICGQLWVGIHQCGRRVPLSNLPAQQLPSGWMCPKCGNAHGPHIATCPQGQLPWSPTFYPTANSGGTEHG